MGLRSETLLIDARDPEAQARWWGELLGWRPHDDGDGDWALEPPEGEGATPLLFQSEPEGKTLKNRLHLDLRPDDQAAEVARAEAMGARRVEIGQSDDPATTWVVLADLEGNEFCILRSRNS